MEINIEWMRWKWWNIESQEIVASNNFFFVPEGPPTGSNWIIQMTTKVALFYQVDEHSLFVIVH